jgi:hypothetical protein
LDLLVEGLLKALEAFGVLGDRPDGFLENNRLRGGGTDHSGEPPQMGRAPGGLGRLPDILLQQEGFETKLGGLEVPQGIFTGAGALANRFVLDAVRLTDIGNRHGLFMDISPDGEGARL